MTDEMLSLTLFAQFVSSSQPMNVPHMLMLAAWLQIPSSCFTVFADAAICRLSFRHDEAP